MGTQESSNLESGLIPEAELQKTTETTWGDCGSLWIGIYVVCVLLVLNACLVVCRAVQETKSFCGRLPSVFLSKLRETRIHTAMLWVLAMLAVLPLQAWRLLRKLHQDNLRDGYGDIGSVVFLVVAIPIFLVVCALCLLCIPVWYAAKTACWKLLRWFQAYLNTTFPPIEILKA